MTQRMIFVKYNNERLPAFQIATEILVDKKRKKIVRKRSLTQKSRVHIKRLYENSEKMSRIQNLEHCRILKLTENFIDFEYINGPTFSESMNRALLGKKMSSFWTLLDEYREEILKYKGNQAKNFSGEVPFEAALSDEEQSILEKLPFSQLTNVDLIPSNVIRLGNKNFHLDYEWIFDTPLPLNYILWRGVFLEYPQWQRHLDISFEDLLNRFSISDQENKLYTRWEKRFVSYVYGEQKKYQFDTSYIRERVDPSIELERLNRENASLKESTEDLQRQKHQLQDELNTIKSSKIWKGLRLIKKTFSLER